MSLIFHKSIPQQIMSLCDGVGTVFYQALWPLTCIAGKTHSCAMSPDSPPALGVLFQRICRFKKCFRCRTTSFNDHPAAMKELCAWDHVWLLQIACNKCRKGTSEYLGMLAVIDRQKCQIRACPDL